jgi:dienelactone hydrolase
MLKHLMHRWERQLSSRDKNRVTLPFGWGLEFLNCVNSQSALNSLLEFNASAIETSESFFEPTATLDYHLEGDRLTFPSSIQSPYPENNTVYARLFSEKNRSTAVIVLPQWNASSTGHVSLCKLLSKMGVTALRLTLPYHEERNPSGPRADFLVSANIGRTIQGIQQAVQDARRAADWLMKQGYERLAIMGTSIGSCISFLTFVHDPRFRVGVFNHVSSFFGDVVWKGISTQHVRRGLESFLTQDELRRLWAVISPNSYVSRLRQSSRRYLLISARYDLTFPPDLSKLLFDEHKRWGVNYDVAFLPCGHYTSALTPFKHLDGFLIARYLRQHLL